MNGRRGTGQAINHLINKPMKIKSLIVAAAAIIVTAASCGLLKSAASTALSAGSSVGSALASIYAQYKADGKIDLSNLGNIINIATIANNLGIFKKNANEATPVSVIDQFTKGLVDGSANLVNKDNSASILSGLTTLSKLDLSSITTAAENEQAVSATAQNVSAAVNALNGILSQFKQK